MSRGRVRSSMTASMASFLATYCLSDDALYMTHSLTRRLALGQVFHRWPPSSPLRMAPRPPWEAERPRRSLEYR